MSSAPDADAVAQASTSPAIKRELLNPFEGPATWLDFANELTRNYMAEEMDDDPYHLLDDHHRRWLEKFDSGDRVLLCHRDGLKTTITLAYLIASLEYKDGYRGIWAMNNQDSVKKKADTEFWRMVDRNGWLTNLNARPKQDTITAKEFQNGSILNSGWLHGGIEGDRAHLLILDDIIKEKGDGDTEDVLDWIEAVCVPMVKDRGRTVVIGTRKRPDDVYAHFRDRGGYQFEEYPAVLDLWDQEFRDDDDWERRRPPEELYTEVPNPWHEGETLQLLWPEARGPEWLAGKRSKMANHRFWREYCLIIRGASGNLIQEADVNKLVENGGCSIRGETPPHESVASGGEQIVVGHDPAQSPTGDNAAFVVLRAHPDGTRVLLDAYAEQGMSPSMIKAQLADYDDRYDPGVIIIEDNGMQQYVVNDALEMNASMRSKVRGISTSGQKHSWENGIPRLRTLVESGGIHFYRGHSPTEEFIQAAMSLTLQDGKLKGHTPDLIAAWYMAEKGLSDFSGDQVRNIGNMRDLL